MPLNTREVLLLIRAKDQASRIVEDIGRTFGSLEGKALKAAKSTIATGGAIAGAGIAAITAGAYIGDFYYQAIQGAADYQQQAAYTLTQIDQVGASLEDIKNIGRDVAQAIPAPFDQMQGALYDIFSSIDVSVADSKVLLEGFAKAGVAGQTDVRNAARTTIAEMNAYHVPVSDVNHLLDLQFQLVRKGVGTYEEFTTSMGRVIPAARAADQSLETMSGTLAFLTRNGLSVSQATTSASRAMELFSRPETVANLEALGVSVRDQQGNFRQLNDIITQLATNQGWAQMTGPERKKAFEDVFGTGSIQARRFFDIAIPNWQDYNSLVSDMQNSAGAMQGAYDIMFKQPQSQVQLLSNNVKVLMTEIGDVFLPYVNKGAEAVKKLVTWFRNLNPGVQKFIIILGAVISALLIVGGIVLVVVGAFMILSGVFALLEISGAVVIGIAAGIVAAIVAIAAVIALVIIHWDTLKKVAVAVWDKIWTAGEWVWKKLQQFWAWLEQVVPPIWDKIWNKIQTFWNWFVQVHVEMYNLIMGWWEAVKNEAIDIWNRIGDSVTSVVSTIVNLVIWMRDRLTEVWNTVYDAGSVVWDALSGTISVFVNDVIGFFIKLGGRIEEIWGKITNLGSSVWATLRQFWDTKGKQIWQDFQNLVKQAWDQVGPIWDEIKQTWDKLWQNASVAVSGFVTVFKAIWVVIQPVVQNVITTIGGYLWLLFEVAERVWNGIAAIVRWAIDNISDYVGQIIDYIQTAWAMWGDNLMAIIGDVWDWIRQTISSVITIISNIIQLFLNLIQGDWGDAWNNIKAIGKAFWDWLWQTVESSLGIVKQLILAAWDAVKEYFFTAWNAIRGFFSDTWNWIIQVASGAVGAIANTLSDTWNKIWSMGENVVSFFTGLPGRIRGLFSGMFDGIKDAFRGALNWVIEKWNNLSFQMPSIDAGPFGTIGGWTLDTPNIPLLALGGQIARGGLAVVGDKGPELLNLPTGATVTPLTDKSAGTTITVAEGAVQIKIEGNADTHTVGLIKQTIDEAFQELVKDWDSR